MANDLKMANEIKIANDSAYKFTSPQAQYDNGDTSYSYTISTTFTPQIVSFQSSGNPNNNKKPNSSPKISSKGRQLQSPSRPKPTIKHGKSTSNILINKKNRGKSSYASSFHNISEHTNDLMPPAPQQRVSGLSMEYDPNAGSYSLTTTYAGIPTYTSEHSASTAFGTSHSPSVSYFHIAPVPMHHTPSVAYLTAPKIDTNTNTNTDTDTNTSTDTKKNSISKPKPIKKLKLIPHSRSLPPTPTRSHSKQSRSVTHRNDMIQENTQYDNFDQNKGYTAKNVRKTPQKQKASTPTIKTAQRTRTRTSNNHSHRARRIRLADLSDIIDDELVDDSNVYNNPQQIQRSRTMNDDMKIKDMMRMIDDESKYTMNSNPLSSIHKNIHKKKHRKNIMYRDGSRSANNSLSSEGAAEAAADPHEFEDEAGGKGPHEAKAEEKKQVIKQKENEDWQIMGDILFSLRHSLICRMYGLNENNDDENKRKKRRSRKKTKAHLQSKQNEWQTFFFEEYAQDLFIKLRANWLNTKGNNKISGTYVKKLFGEKNKGVPVEQLDINKSCKYYWRRLNTNSKSGQIFFQTVNGEYIIKSMPKSEAEFFRKSFLEKYYLYMLDAPDSLLMHIMGCYNIRYKKEKVNNMNLASNNEYNSKRKQDVNKGVYVIVMKSILFCAMSPTVKMHKIYDLKGSKHNRTASRYKLELDKLTLNALLEIDDHSFEQEINNIENINDNIKLISNAYCGGFYQPKKNENKTKFKKDNKNKQSGSITVYKRSKVLKDLDFMQDNERINIGEKIKKKYVVQLRTDLDFLIKMNVMDYSLLVGIHRLDNNFSKKKSGHRRQHSNAKPKRIKIGNLFTFEFGGMCAEKVMFENKKNIYFTGIIDFLQKYNTKKKMESYYKRVKVSEGKDAISSVDSKTYANRLYDFIEKRII